MTLKVKGNTANKNVKRGQKRTNKVPRGHPKPKCIKIDTGDMSPPDEQNVPEMKKTTRKSVPPKKPVGSMSSKMKKILTAMANGIPLEDAYLAIHNKKPSYSTKVSIQQKMEKKRLTDPAFVEAAQSIVMKAMKLKTVVRHTHDGPVTITPSYAQGLMAASMVMERAEPAIKHTVAVQVQARPVDLSRFYQPPASTELALPVEPEPNALLEPIDDVVDV